MPAPCGWAGTSAGNHFDNALDAIAQVRTGPAETSCKYTRSVDALKCVSAPCVVWCGVAFVLFLDCCLLIGCVGWLVFLDLDFIFLILIFPLVCALHVRGCGVCACLFV